MTKQPYVRNKPQRIELTPVLHGGGHERGYRSGTLNVPGIVGFGKAAELARTEMAEEAAKLTALRNRLYDYLRANLKEVHLNGSWEHRLPGNLNLSFAYVDAMALLVGLERVVAVSSGSACTSAQPEPSHVLRAIGVPEELARGSLRFGLGRFTTAEDVEYVVAEVARVVRHLRAMSPAYELHRHELRQRVLRTADDYARITRELAEDAARQNIRYLELTFAPPPLDIAGPFTPGDVVLAEDTQGRE